MPIPAKFQYSRRRFRLPDFLVSPFRNLRHRLMFWRLVYEIERATRKSRALSETARRTLDDPAFWDAMRGKGGRRRD